MVLNNVQNVEPHIFATHFAMQLGRKSLVSKTATIAVLLICIPYGNNGRNRTVLADLFNQACWQQVPLYLFSDRRIR